MTPITAIILDTRSKKTDNSYPVKVRITYNRTQKYYQTGIDITEEKWKQYQEAIAILNDPTRKKAGISKDIKSLADLLTGFHGKAINIIKELRSFSFAAFKVQYYGNKTTAGSLVNLFRERIQVLKKEERISSAESYQSTLNSLKDYKLSLRLKKKFEELTDLEKKELREKVKIDLDEVTVEFLNAYEKWMENVGNSMTTTGIYLRSLRTIINLAITNKVIDKDNYPFGKGQFEIPAGRNIKKALRIEDVRNMMNYQVPENSTIQKARDFWVLSYLLNGINTKDILLLKFSNWDGDYIEFVRAKTKRSKKSNQTPIRIFLLPQAQNIMNRWAVEKRKADSYIFPVINDSMSAEKKHATVRQFIKTVNKYIRRIAKDLGIERDVTSYVARHTFSTVLKRSGVNTEYISEALGHASKATTENYLASFEDDMLKMNTLKLL